MVEINGYGATNTFIDATKAEFLKDTGHTVNYTSTGSSTGVKNFFNNIGDFAIANNITSVTPSRETFVYVPLTAAPMAIAHNLPGKKKLYLSPTTVANIFSGTITKWNDPAIVADNTRTITKKVKVTGKTTKTVPVIKTVTVKTFTLPNAPITVAYRSDSSATSKSFTDYLNKVQSTIWTKPGDDYFRTAFPGNGYSALFQGAGSNEAAAQVAMRIPYSITYLESTKDVTAHNLKSAYIQNAAGKFVAPTSVGTDAFLGAATVDAMGLVTYNYATTVPRAYPIIGQVIYGLGNTGNAGNSQKNQVVKAYFTYFLEKSSATMTPLGYVPLTGELLAKAKTQITKIGNG